MVETDNTIEKFNDDYRNLTGVDIFDLVKTFKVKSGYDPSLFLSRMKEYIYSNIAETPVESSANVIRIIDRLASRSSEIKNDDLLKFNKVVTYNRMMHMPLISVCLAYHIQDNQFLLLFSFCHVHVLRLPFFHLMLPKVAL